jgi:multidrug transporter EmrE-like cation transporter
MTSVISNLTFLYEITIASIVEYIGDASIKLYSRLDNNIYLIIGILCYLLLVYFLIHILKYSNVMQMNIQWDAMSVILETLLAYILLSERLSNDNQYIGFFMIVSGLIIMNLGKSSYN